MSTIYSVHLRVEGETNLQRVIQLAQDGIQVVKTSRYGGRKDLTRTKRDNLTAKAKDDIVKILKNDGTETYAYIRYKLTSVYNREIVLRAFRNLLSEQIIIAHENGRLTLRAQK